MKLRAHVRCKHIANIVDSQVKGKLIAEMWLLQDLRIGSEGALGSVVTPEGKLKRKIGLYQIFIHFAAIHLIYI